MKEELEQMIKFLESDDYKRAQEIAKKSIKEMVEIQDKAEKFDQMKVILESFFAEEAAESNMNDYVLCYETLGQLCDISRDTSEKRIPEES